MLFRQFKVEGLGCYSYLIGCPRAGVAFVVDPERHVNQYLRAAEQQGVRITHVFDTHLHADHISGAVELADKVGADVYVHPKVEAQYPHKNVKEGDRFTLGVAEIEVIETPGHTPNSVSIAVADTSRASETMLLLTGDLLFVGDVGRPDLTGEDLLEQQVQGLYNSLYTTLSRFPDWTEVYPAHGEGSLCGKGMSSKPMTTLGFERKHNPLLNEMPFDEFRRTMMAGFQVRPMGFTQIVVANQAGPAGLSSLREVRRLSMGEIEKLQSQGATLIDVRHATAFGASFIPASINIGLTPQSATWLGMVVETNRNLVIVCDSEADSRVAIDQFRRVGFDNIIGFFDGGVSAWAASARLLDHLPQLSVQSLEHVLEKYPDHIVLDVRTEQEWERGHIEKAIHKPIADLVREGIDFGNKQQHITAICGSGYRSNIAGSFLKSKGYEQVFSVIGGMTAWERMHRS